MLYCLYAPTMPSMNASEGVTQMIHRRFWTGLASALVVLTPTLASAYGLWTAHRAGEIVVVYGKGPADRAYDPSTIRSVVALDADGETVSTVLEPHEKRVTVNAGRDAAIFLVDGDMGIFSQDSGGYWRKGSKDDVPGSTLTQRFLKYGISVTHLHGDLPDLPAQTLQIRPLGNPAEAEVGDALKVRVLFRGKPLAGAEIIPDYVNLPRENAGRTDRNGEAELTVRNDGINVVAVVHLEKTLDDPQVDLVEHIATLTFPAHQPHSR